MISLGAYHKHFNPLDLEKYAGVKFELRVCAGPTFCRRPGEHNAHFWYEEIALTDPVRVRNPKKDHPDRVDINIRWLNYCWAILQVMKTEKLKDLDLARRALFYAREHCFDIDGSPSNLAMLNQYSSYAKFMASVEEQLKALE